jgi:hypothetical protein
VGQFLKSTRKVTSELGGSTIIALATAAGFLLGAVTLWAFASGLGVTVLDLGLDLQGYVTVAAGTLILPVCVGLLFAAGYVLEKRSDLSGIKRSVYLGSLVVVPAVLVFVFFGTVPLSWGWWGLLIWVAVLAGYLLASALPLAAIPDDIDDDLGEMLAVLIVTAFGLLASVLMAFGFGYAWGLEVRNGGARDFNGPLTLELVAPATRGVISIDGRTACVDRVGTNLVIGSDGPAVVTEWQSFIHNSSCDRDSANGLLNDE